MMLVCLAGSMAFSAGVYSAHYYVDASHSAANDSNPGTEAAPWKTIQKAASSIVAGDTAYIKNGTYQEQVQIANSGNVGQYITLRAYQLHGAIIDGTSINLPEYSGLLEVEAKNYIRISGFRVQNSGPLDTAAGIQVEGSNNVVIEHNHTFNTASSGIIAWNSQDITIDGNEVEQALSAGATSENECISVGETNGFEVVNNHVHHGNVARGEGIDTKDGSMNGRVHGNHVHHVQNVGIYVDAWDKATRDIDVYRNNIHHIGSGSGIALGSEMGGNLSNIRIYNNLIYNNELLGIDVHACCIDSHPVKNVQVLNNTLFNNGIAPWGGGIYVENTQATGVVIRNNIVSDNLGFQISLESPAPTDIIIDYNLIDGYIGDPGEVRGDNYQEGDPLFVSAADNDFHLQASSPAINHGMNDPLVTTDYDENPRPAGTGTDIGAYEFGTQAESSWWQPGVNTLWQWQLGGSSLDISLVADMYDIDYEETTAATVTALHASGRKAVCYISVGSWENWRGDAANFPAIILGNDYQGWPGEKWLDIRRIDLLGPILRKRLDMCRDKGFDGVEPDNMDGYTNNTGFPLTEPDQLAFNLWLAKEAHQRGLSIGMKNDSDQVAKLLPYFDWALTEDCFVQGWCADMQPFIAAGKPVFAAEYTDTGLKLPDFCGSAVTMGFRGILKKRDLTAFRQSCDGNITYTAGNITVPSQTISSGNSLTWAATKQIVTSGRLTVNAGATLNLRGPEHFLNPGLQINAGAWFRASR